MKEDEVLVGNPLIYCAFALFLGAFDYTIFYENEFIGVAFAASFFIIVFLTLNKELYYMIIIFFIMGYFINMIYFTTNLPDKNAKIVVNIMEDRGFIKRATYKGKELNILKSKENFKKGDIVYLEGEFKRNIDFSRGNIGEIETNYAKKIAEGKLSKVNLLKENLYKKFSEVLGEENTGVLMALSFGEDQYISKEHKEELKDLGVIHAISVSGFHMAIIFKVLDFIPFLSVKSFVAFLYVLFTGAKPSTTRAFIMIFILKVSPKIFKSYNVLAALSFSSLIILSLKPYYVVNPGFVLSYLAVLGIIIFNNKISRKLYKLPKFIRESLSLTISSQSLSSFYSIAIFNQYSMGGFLGNLFLLPFYSFIVILGNVALIFNTVPFIFKPICYIILSIMELYNIIENLLLRIVPKSIYLNYFHILCFVFIIFSYILIKKGFKYAKFSTIPIAIFYFLSVFNLFPQINFYNIGTRECAIIKYKWNSIAICKNPEDLKKIKEPIDKSFILDNYQTEEIELRNYTIIGKSSKTFKNNIILEFQDEKEKFIITTLSKKYLNISYEDVKIIEAKGKKLYNNYGKSFAKLYLIE